MRAEITALLAKDTIDLVTRAEMNLRFYSPYFIVPKKSSGLRSVLYLRVLNQPLHTSAIWGFGSTGKRASFFSCAEHLFSRYGAGFDKHDRFFSPWSDPALLRVGVPLVQVTRHVVVTTDASKTGWGAYAMGMQPWAPGQNLDCSGT